VKRHNAEGFTLIELLVVIAIIALLMAIIMPALHAAKEIAATAVCLSNQKQLGTAYYVYAGENDGNLADGVPANTADGWETVTVGTKTYKVHGFVAEPKNQSGGFANDTLEDKIRGFELGAIWPYLEAHKVYNCPMDKRWLRPPTDTANARGTIGGYRSYSIGAVLSAHGYNETGTQENKVTVMKYSDIVSPGSKIVFIEEADGSGFNHFTWNLYLGQQRYWDPIAIWHNGSSTFSFADGHADKFKWTDDVMIDMASPDPKGGNKNRDADPKSDDYERIRRMYMPRPFK
jgi:prepilin-type N-terminal cleavage/methylation domain-containing protein/prepilin-type processing-associated H-X9-DG protein